MATNIIQSFNFLSVQTGNGTPNHISNKPTLYFDKNSDLIYVTDGIGDWVYLLDSSMPITGGTSGGTNTFITGFTYSNNNLSLYRNDNVILTVNASIFTGLTVNGILSATTYQNLPTDIFVTGGTYSNGTAIFTNNTGGTFSVNGFSTGNTSGVDVFVTGGTTNNSTKIYTFTNNTGGTFSVTALTDLTITGGTYSNGTAIFTNNTGGTFSVSGLFTGGTDVFVTGGTFNNNTILFTNNTGGTYSVLINNLSGLTVNGSISATTYSGFTVTQPINSNNTRLANTAYVDAAVSSMSVGSKLFNYYNFI